MGNPTTSSLGTRCLVIGVALLSAASSVLAGEYNIVQQEHLARMWTGQLVTYPFQAEKGQCVANSLTLAGPNGPQPVQLFDVQYWPGTDNVQSGKIAFVVDELKPLSTNTYTLGYGMKTVPPVASSLQVTADAKQVEMATEKMAVRVPLGSRTFDPPATSDTVPPPISALRIGTEPWFEGSNLYGPGQVKAWSAKLIDHGPVFTRVKTTYTYANGTILQLDVQASTGENTIRVDMDVTGQQIKDGWRLTLNPATPFSEMKTIYGVGNQMREGAAQVPTAASDTPLLYLSPWAGDYWFPDSPQIIRMVRAGASELQLCVRDVGDWVVPQPRPAWSNFNTWTNAFVAIPLMWSGWQSRRIPLLATGNHGVQMQINLMEGKRHWTMTSAADGTAVRDTFLRKSITTHSHLPLLNEVKDMVLDWPDGTPEQPSTVAADQPLVKDDMLDKLGQIDLFRMNDKDTGAYIFNRYQQLLNRANSPAQRRLYKAQMAYLAYMAANPFHWSFERGYCSGNPNMTVTRVCNIGNFGYTLRAHPKSQEWREYATQWMRYWLKETVTDKGFWPESAHYTDVTLFAIDYFANMSRPAEGYRIIDDPKYKLLQQLYRGKIATPTGRIVPYGRGIGSWLGGPRRADWTSEHFSDFGFILRSHAPTPGENFLLYLPYKAKCADGAIWQHQVGSIGSWYAAGKAVAGWYPEKGTQPDWAFKPHVVIDDIAKNGALSRTRSNSFALLPRADYISASYSYAEDPQGVPWACNCGRCNWHPVSFRGKTDDYAWTTQLLLASDDKSDGINYLIMRDTLDIDKASTWTFPAVDGMLDAFVVSPAIPADNAFQLKLPGAGVYYVALIPKSNGTVERSASGDGKVIRLSGAFGTDYCFLGKPTGDKGAYGDAMFDGIAGAVQDRPTGLMLQLSAPGSVRYKAYGLAGTTPAALRVAADTLIVSLSEPWGGGEITIQAPGTWTPDKASGAQLKENGPEQMVLTVPAGVKTVQLVKAR